MAHKIGLYYDGDGLSDIMSSSQMEAVEQQIMMRKKSEVEAAFLQRFGVPGEFKFSIVKSDRNKTWNGGHYYGGRVIYRIIPDGKRTYAILRAHPDWIQQFIG